MKGIMSSKTFQVKIISVVSTIYNIVKSEEEIKKISEEDLMRQVRNEAYGMNENAVGGGFYNSVLLHAETHSVKSVIKKEEFFNKRADEDLGVFLSDHIHDTSELMASPEYYPKHLLEELD